MWFTGALCEAFIQAKKDPENVEPALTMLKCGWSGLWQKMVKDDQLDVRFGHQVTKIDRTASGVTVSGTVNQSADYPTATSTGSGETFSLEGTHVFIACPFQSMAGPLDTGSGGRQAWEKEMTDALVPFTLCTTLFEADPHQSKVPPSPPSPPSAPSILF